MAIALTVAAAPASTALSAFLRGIERRGFVLAEAQCGDPGRAETALAAAMTTFRRHSAQIPLPAWPQRFWTQLVTRPELHDAGPARAAGPEATLLAALSTGPRAALLLRLVAGLDLAHAAQVMGVSETAYRHALYRALRRLREIDAAGVPDALALRDSLHRRVKTLPEPRLAALAALRERILAGENAAVPVTRDPPRAPPRWLLPALWSVLALLVLAFAGTFVWSAARPVLVPGDVRTLPDDSTAPPTLAPDAALLAHPDFELLTDPAGARAATRLDFDAWYAVHGDPAAAATTALQEADSAAGGDSEIGGAQREPDDAR